MQTNTSTKPFVFTLMPFHTDFNDTWKLGIKAACEDAGTYGERVDEQIYEERMLDRIYNQINKADIIVADMTGKNPNVFYEVGYAHALNKRVILIIQEAADIPFDLKHHPFIVYNKSISTLKSELTKKLLYFIQNPEVPAIPDNTELVFSVNGTRITEDSVLEVKGNFYGLTEIPLPIDILNKSQNVVSNIKLGLLTDEGFVGDDSPNKRLIPTEEGYILHFDTESIIDLYPSSYHRIDFIPHNNRTEKLEGQYKMVLQVFTAYGVNSVNFIVDAVQPINPF
ncbi:nucleoside 2-deoxyribosyltransferase [Ferruginibacter sp. HRS2-29]|uniref:nucleoside 2-deoxyribosyltransferase n=1 Tax=Ferruginibacter sp. HRS2-29 TaxID=2487334 RepID=UPI0020CB983D|nr:nucleoside 2-deoxyribosyltransferase [Ferruginibacter sp. HRS2-29]